MRDVPKPICAVLIAGALLAASGGAVAADGAAGAVCEDLQQRLQALERRQDHLSDAAFLQLEQDYRAMNRLVRGGPDDPANRQELQALAERWGVSCSAWDRRCDLGALESLYRQQSDARDARRRDITRLRARMHDAACRPPETRT